jgi:hypothetical protein
VPDDQAHSSAEAGKRSGKLLFAVAAVLLIFAVVMFQYCLSNQLLQLSLRG